MLFIKNLLHTFTSIEVFVLIMYGGFIILLILFGWDLLERFLKADKRMRHDPAYLVFFIIGIAMLGYGIYMFPSIIKYFLKTAYEEIGMNIAWIEQIMNTLIILMITPIGYVCSLIIFKKMKAISYGIGTLGALASIYMLIRTVVAFINPSKLGAFNMIPIIIVVILFGLLDFFGIVYILIVKLAPQKEVRKRVLFGILGIAIAGIGGYIEVNSRGSQNWWYVYGVLIELIGFIVMRFFFLSIPSYDEFAWRSGMIEMHVIIAETGISLYYCSFADLNPEDIKGDLKVTATVPESQSRPNSDLVAGGLVGIKGMLSEISGDKGKLENIEIGKKSLVFKQGKNVLCLLLADENLGVYHSMLTDLVFKIEESHPNLDEFNGDTRKIHIEPIVQELFDLKKK